MNDSEPAIGHLINEHWNRNRNMGDLNNNKKLNRFAYHIYIHSIYANIAERSIKCTKQKP